MTLIETVRALYDAFRAKDGAALLSLLDPNVEWIQNEGFPGGGRHVGAERVLQDAFRKLRSEWDEWRADVSEWHADGDTVVALGEYGGTHKTTRRAMRAAFAHVYTVRDGRIVRFRQYTDTAVIAAAGQPAR